MPIRGERSATWYDDAFSQGHASRRIYPFHLSLNGSALSSAGSTVVVNPPMVELQSGVVPGAGPQSRGREMVEKQISGYQMQSGYDGLDYWSRPHRLQVFVTLGLSSITRAEAVGYFAMFMNAPGLPVWADPPIIPQAMLLYRVDSPTMGQNETFELWTAPGDGVTPYLKTVLTGTDPVRSPLSPGGQRTEHWALAYQPGQYVSAYINGKEGARHTTNLPITTTLPGLSANLSGWGAYVENGDINNKMNAAIHSAVMETYRP